MSAHRKTEADFWAQTDRQAGGCWIWTGFTKNGYGRVGFANKRWRAHRLAWVLTHGPIQDGMLVCHSCDRPACINPEHLFLGTPKDNMDDMNAKGRGRFPGAPLKISDQQVSEIKTLYAAGGVTQRALASEFNIDQSYVSLIVNGKYRGVSCQV